MGKGFSRCLPGQPENGIVSKGTGDPYGDNKPEGDAQGCPGGGLFVEKKEKKTEAVVL
jgi:hypothetical protein